MMWSRERERGEGAAFVIHPVHRGYVKAIEDVINELRTLQIQWRQSMILFTSQQQHLAYIRIRKPRWFSNYPQKVPN